MSDGQLAARLAVLGCRCDGGQHRDPHAQARAARPLGTVKLLGVGWGVVGWATSTVHVAFYV